MAGIAAISDVGAEFNHPTACRRFSSNSGESSTRMGSSSSRSTSPLRRIRSSYTLSDELALVAPGEDGQDVEGRLTSLVLNGITSANSRRAYAAGLRQFFAWARTQPPRTFSKALVQEYRAWLNEQKLSPATVNLRLSPIRKLAQEMADNGLIDEHSRVGSSECRG
jgi:Phage integrase, N-terminal SAM-like domain